MADDGGEECNGEVGWGEDVAEGEGEGFAAARGAVELSHEEVGVEEEDDECNLDGCAEEAAEAARRVWIWGHETILQGGDGSQSAMLARQRHGGGWRIEGPARWSAGILWVCEDGRGCW